MGRHAAGPVIYTDPRTGLHYVRFTHKGRRFNVATGTRDRREAEERKGQAYADAVRGRRKVSHATAGADPIEVYLAQWLEAISAEQRASTSVMSVGYAKKFTEFFVTLQAVTSATIADYRRMRLREVKRTTVLKELSGLRTFLAWCKEQQILEEVPVVESPPKNVSGTADTRRPHKAKATKITPEEARLILGELPELAARARRGKDRSRVRDFFVVAWETGLRPITIGRLTCPAHYRKGAAELFIPKEIDKAQFERQLPLTKACRAALDRCAPKAGPIFGHHDYRTPFDQALARLVSARKIPAERAALISKYDFRHGRTTDLASSTTNLAAVQYLVGHRHLSTTSKYVEAPKESAAAVLRGLESGGIAAGKAKRWKRP